MPPKPVAVKPAGKLSVTVTVPLVAALPTLLTVIVYCWPTSPWVKLPLWLFRMVRSEMGVTRDTAAPGMRSVSRRPRLAAP